MKTNCLLVVAFACLGALALSCQSNSSSVYLTTSFDPDNPGCRILQLQAGYSSASEEQVRVSMDDAVQQWLKEHSSFELVGVIESLTMVSSDGETTVYYRVRPRSAT